MLEKMIYASCENKDIVMVMYDYDNETSNFINYTKEKIVHINDLKNAFYYMVEELLQSEIDYIYSMHETFMELLIDDLKENLRQDYKTIETLKLLLAIEKYKEDNCI